MSTLAAIGQDTHIYNGSRMRIVEAPPGSQRRGWLTAHLQEMGALGTQTFFASCDFDSGGPWAGVNDVLSAMLPQIQEQRNDLVERHLYELIHVIPELKLSKTLPHANLTDLARDGEKVRNYAADRAFRLVHGLIDLIDGWKTTTGADVPWIIACDGFDTAGKMSRTFFRELMRRRGESLNISLIAAVAPGNGKAATESLNAAPLTQIVHLDLTAEPAPAEIDQGQAAQKAGILEDRIGGDALQKQIHLSELIQLWQQAGRPDKVLRLKYFAMLVYLHLGLYEDAVRYSRGLVQLADEYASDNLDLRWWIMMKTLNGLMGIQDAEGALQLGESVGLKLAGDVRPAWRIELLYLIAMLYARFRKPRDFVKGEEYLDRALAEIEHGNLAAEEFHFQYVFNRNGVAMIRSFQGRHQEALALCQTGIDRMNAHISADQHRLHRSVLFYNIAQVYAATGHDEASIAQYSLVIEMDPNYSEYYNERASIFLRLGRLEEARADYLKAIELSPPYFEVFTNLGQCYRNLGELPEAISSYSRALDLEPKQFLALLGRAQSYEELGQCESAIEDYSAALMLDSTVWEAIASRGVLYYQAGDLTASLADFNRAIELDSEQVGLYKNRSIVLSDLGRFHEAARDLETALRLNPEEEERADIQERLDAARRAVASDLQSEPQKVNQMGV
jgi:tetratricopeptide (TPR) repeat protein